MTPSALHLKQDDRHPAPARGRLHTMARGARSGGCAFRGAKLALQPIVDAAHLVHGPITCVGHSWDSRPTASSGSVLHRTTFITDLGEAEVIYGGRERLTRAIRELVEKYDPPAVFVYQTCLTAMIGEDLAALCRAASAAHARPVIPVDAPGFSGGKDAGSEFGADVLFDRVIGTREPEVTTPTDVALIGEYNVAGELARVRPLLEALGIRILASLSGDGRFDEIAGAHRARASIALCSKAVIGLAQKLENRWGIPFVQCSFYGRAQISSSLRRLAQLLVARGAPADLLRRTEDFIQREEAHLQTRLAPYRARLTGRRALLVTGGVKSWSLVSALQDAGMEVVGSSMHKANADDRRQALQILGSPARVLESISNREAYQWLARGEAQVLLSGGGARFAAWKARAPFIDIHHERLHPYCGYEGALALVAEVDRAISNPIWREVRRPAPWEGGAPTQPDPAGEP